MRGKFTVITKEVDRYDSISDFAQDVLDCYDVGYGEKEFLGVSIVSGYAISIAVLNFLIRNSDFDLYSSEIFPEELDEYNGEYIITINEDGLIFCEKAKRGDVYLLIGGENEITYVHEDVSNAFCRNNKHSDMIFFAINNDFCEM